MSCIICGQNVELRMGYCWKCAEAQSIIAEGLDMREKGSGGQKIKAFQADERLKMLIEKGWR